MAELMITDYYGGTCVANRIVCTKSARKRPYSGVHIMIFISQLGKTKLSFLLLQVSNTLVNSCVIVVL
jgi:hypothetical protein